MIRNNKIKLLQLTSLLVMFIIAALYFSADLKHTEVEKERCNDNTVVVLRPTQVCEND